MPEYRWEDHTVDLARSWNPKLHPRGWGGMFGVNTKAPAGSGSAPVVQRVKPATKVYSKSDARAFGAAPATRRVAGRAPIGSRARPLRASEVLPATRRGNPSVPAAMRANQATQLPSRRQRASLAAGARAARGWKAVAGVRQRMNERRASRPPKFKKGEFVSITPGPGDRTLVDRMRRREGKARVGQVVGKRPDGKYLIRTEDGNRDVHEAMDPQRLTAMKVNPGDPLPMRAARPVGLRENVQRARRVWNAFNG